MDNWLVLTAGLGSNDFEKAARRIEESCEGISFVSKVIKLSEFNLVKYCPNTYEVYNGFLNSRTKGYGYMSWKAEVCSLAIEGAFGEFAGIIWIDSGCEIFDSSWTRRRFSNMLTEAVRNGLVTFTLDTPESKYTKAFAFTAALFAYIKHC